MQRIVTRLPLSELWDEGGSVAAICGSGLTAAGIQELLRLGPVRFVVAEPGAALCWIPEGECFEFWKTEVRMHVADPPGAYLADFPDEYCYFASEWSPENGPPIVVLSAAH